MDMKDLLLDNVSLLEQLDTLGGPHASPSLPGTLKPRFREIASARLAVLFDRARGWERRLSMLLIVAASGCYTVYAGKHVRSCICQVGQFHLLPCVEVVPAKVWQSHWLCCLADTSMWVRVLFA